MTALGPGVRVKCIRDDGDDHPVSNGSFPAIGSVWTVDEMVEDDEGDQAFTLVEWADDDCFYATHFVPLDGAEDISALEAALKKGRVDSDAPARKRDLERAK